MKATRIALKLFLDWIALVAVLVCRNGSPKGLTRVLLTPLQLETLLGDNFT